MDKKESRELKRIERSKLNTTVALVTNIIMGVLSFAERTVFNQFFIEDYLGLYSFNNKNHERVYAGQYYDTKTFIDELVHKHYDKPKTVAALLKAQKDFGFTIHSI